MIVGEIEQNDDKVRSVYGGSVEQAACRNLARSCAPKPGRVPKPGRRSHADARPGRLRRSLAAGRVPKPGRAPVTARRGPARRGAARPGPAEGERRERRTRRRLRSLVHVDERPTGRVVLPTFGNKSRKTTKSYPSTGDQFCESRKTAKFDAPVGFPGRGVTTTLSRKRNGRARHFANFRKFEENDKVRSVYGGSVGETRISV